MASVRDHCESIERNERFFQHLRGEQNYPEWAVVVIFYISVHYCRALLSHVNENVTSHPLAQTVFLKKFRDRQCYKHLEILKKEAEKARYDNVQFSWEEIEALIENRLKPFKACAKNLATQHELSLPA